MPKASILSRYGDPEVLEWSDVEMPKPGPAQIRIRVQAAGVSPTDLKIRRGDLDGVFPLPSPAVLGFEAAGIVDAIGADVRDIALGDEVAVLLPMLGGYGEFALASAWTLKPSSVSWANAAALPSSAEAAVGIMKELGVIPGETMLILGGGGSVGVIATQLAAAQGIRVVSAASAADQSLVEELGAIPVLYGEGLRARVLEHVDGVDAVLDAGGKGGLEEAIALAGGPARVMTLADMAASSLGVTLSVPTPERAPEALDDVMPRLASGDLRLRAQLLVPMERAYEAHALLESGETHQKVILTTG